MRLTEHQLKSVKETFVRYFLAQDKIYLFGSRVDLAKKGGDIDLYIETNYEDANIVVTKKIEFLAALKQKIGDQKIDLVINCLKNNARLTIYDEAKKTGVQLK